MNKGVLMNQKIVINSCFGRFGLSTDAILRLIEMGSDAIEKRSIEKYSGCKAFKAYKEDRLNRFSEFKDVGNGFCTDGVIEDIVYKDNAVYYLKDSHDYKIRDYKIRANKDLIKVVKEMGDKVNGGCAKLKIVEIPSDVSWVIDEYDGLESVDEEHRSWS